MMRYRPPTRIWIQDYKIYNTNDDGFKKEQRTN